MTRVDFDQTSAIGEKKQRFGDFEIVLALDEVRQSGILTINDRAIRHLFKDVVQD